MRSSGSPGVPMSVVAQPASSARETKPAARISTVMGNCLACCGVRVSGGARRIRLGALRLGDFLRAPALRQVLLQLADARVESLALDGVDAGHGLREAQLV